MAAKQQSSTSPTSTRWTAEDYQTLAGKALLPQHLAQLLASGISLEVAAERGYYSATTKVQLSALGFAGSQQRVPALVIPLWSVDGEVALHQLRPDDPRTASDGRPVKYETPKRAGLRLDLHPRMRQFVGDPERPLFLTEGIKKVDAAATADLCSLGLLGVSGWRGRNQDGGVTALADWEHIQLKSRRTYVVFDSDVMTKTPVYYALLKLRTWLESKGADVLVVYLPSGAGGAKVGLDDYLAAGHSRDELMALATKEVTHPDSTEPGDQAWQVGDYRMDAVKGTFRTSADGEARKLANFAARIVRKSFDDDGDPSTESTGAEELEAIRYEIEVQQGQRHAPVEVTGAEFSSMRWPSRVRLLDLIVGAGPAVRDQMREAIEQVSREAAHQQGLDLIPRVTTYIHTGWTRTGGGEWIYLHAGGSIGVAGLLTDASVRLPTELGSYRLPSPPVGATLGEAVRASLGLIDLGPPRLMVPVLGAVYRSVLGASDFALHSHGASGQFKTQIAKLALAHFGQCQDPTQLPVISWTSTGNSVEGLLHQAKDTLGVVDDLLPAGLSSRERDAMLATAARVFRAQGNQGGRSRMRADSTIRPPKAPRGLVFSTGEELPRGLSGIARVWLIEQRSGDVTSDTLTTAQEQAPLYSVAMAGYLRWLAPQMPGMLERIRQGRASLRGAYPASHSRTSEIAAHLELGWQIFVEFAVACGAADQTQADTVLASVRAALLEGCRDQVEEQIEANPVEVYRRGLQGAVSSGRVYVEGTDGDPPPGPGSWGWVPREVPQRDGPPDITWEPANRQGRVGWLVDDDLYLLPEAAYKAAAAQSDGGLGIGQAALHRRLRENRLLASTGTGRNIPTMAPRAIDPSRPRVLHFPLSFLVAPVAPVAPEPPSDGKPSSNHPLDGHPPGATSQEPSRTSRTSHDYQVAPPAPLGATSPAGGATSEPPNRDSRTNQDSETEPLLISDSVPAEAPGATGATGATKNSREDIYDARVPAVGVPGIPLSGHDPCPSCGSDERRWAETMSGKMEFCAICNPATRAKP